ncbi:hypothetical protein O181_030272 [Austropuccinia psidii MF-1]|uniref:Uncharacterized protein n=1 Tax=Austropuccinia psidii MF-1 TaxID=1389203 RepID=A0A9Q3H4A2_9BASI|nr:hypothetical protein [Austropuccinia psidii MF-1]
MRKLQKYPQSNHTRLTCVSLLSSHMVNAAPLQAYRRPKIWKRASLTPTPFFGSDNLGGISGVTGNPIANPTTGGFGYETSDGKFHDGAADTSKMQRGHDSKYPGFSLPPAWKKVRYPSGLSAQPRQPKCGGPNDANKDPGQVKGSYGNYTPAPARNYKAPSAQRLGM